MTNREKYAEQILDLAVNGKNFAFCKEEKIVSCAGLWCPNCIFYSGTDNCSKNKECWSRQEYVEPPVDWSKVPVDTKVYVRDFDNGFWIPRHFARFEDEKIVTWNDGATSFSIDDFNNVSKWNQGKLAEDTV